jgi:hypothetical protein
MGSFPPKETGRIRQQVRKEERRKGWDRGGIFES